MFPTPCNALASLAATVAEAANAPVAASMAATKRAAILRPVSVFVIFSSFCWATRLSVLRAASFLLTTGTPYEGDSPVVMSIRPELVGKRFPSRSGMCPMCQESFASRVLANRSGEMSGTHSRYKKQIMDEAIDVIENPVTCSQIGFWRAPGPLRDTMEPPRRQGCAGRR